MSKKTKYAKLLRKIEITPVVSRNFIDSLDVVLYVEVPDVENSTEKIEIRLSPVDLMQIVMAFVREPGYGVTVVNESGDALSVHTKKIGIVYVEEN